MTSKTLGILTYIDDTPNMLEEFSWIYKSWIYSGNWRTSDIIAVCNPSAYDKLPVESGIIRIARSPLSQPGSPWADYPFINSIGCLVGSFIDEIAGNYTHLLRSDADVFLTQNLVGFRPNIPVFGRGHYADTAEVRQKLTAYAEKLGFEHHGVFNCGHSLLASSSHVVEFLREQYSLCEILLEEFKDDPGQWPGWCRNVLTMYAAELVANKHWASNLRVGFHNILDYETVLWSDIAASGVYHIHALHVTGQHWSKIDYRAGAYRDYDLASLDIRAVHDYCHWIAATSLGEIKRMSNYAG